MITITRIREYMGQWARQTYLSGLDYCYFLKSNRACYDITIEVLKKLDLTDRIMNGNSIEHIPNIHEWKTEVLYTDIFWSIAEEYITPVHYVAKIVNECVKKGVPSNAIPGHTARGLRAFPSFLREMDLAYKVSNFFPKAEIINGPELDTKYHTDILVRDDENVYMLWSYQSSKRGLDNTSQRFNGYRGELPKGYIVLCPIKIRDKDEAEDVHGWMLYSEQYVRKLCEMITAPKPDNYQSLMRLNGYRIRSYLSKAHIVKK